MTVIALATIAAWRWSGGWVFAPADLSAASGEPLGGVRSHAELANDCGACHVAPWSKETMDTRCVRCHTGITGEGADSSGLHGALADASQCRSCHTEHKGTAGELTKFDLAADDAGTRFDHARTSFPLTGAHSAVTCRGCHQDALSLRALAATPTECISCHRAEDTHQGSLGVDCAACHTTATWDDADFDHTFPLAHGTRNRQPSECALCHQDAPADYERYTCYGCHEHAERRVLAEHREEGISTAEIVDCVACHRTGREHERGRDRRERDEH